MKYMKPFYYDSFRCVADGCPASCCEGWQIMIDDESLERYLNWQGKFGGRLLNSIDWKEGAFLQYGRKCAFLNDKGLCDIQTEAGETALCRTCREYPRHVEEFEGVREYSLSLSCPEAARIMLSQKGRTRFITWEDQEEDEFEEDFDFLLYTELLEAREVVFSILEGENAPFEARMEECLHFAAGFQELLEEGDFSAIQEWTKRYSFDLERGMENAAARKKRRFEDTKECLSLLKGLEHLEPGWEELLEKVERTLYLEGQAAYDECYEKFHRMRAGGDFGLPGWDGMMEKIAMFFLYTYFCGAVYDDAVYSKALFAAFSAAWIEELMLAHYRETGEMPGEEELMEAAWRYAREIEHSDQNLNALEDWFWESTHAGEEFVQL